MEALKEQGGTQLAHAVGDYASWYANYITSLYARVRYWIACVRTLIQGHFFASPAFIAHTREELCSLIVKLLELRSPWALSCVSSITRLLSDTQFKHDIELILIESAHSTIVELYKAYFSWLRIWSETEERRGELTASLNAAVIDSSITNIILAQPEKLKDADIMLRNAMESLKSVYDDFGGDLKDIPVYCVSQGLEFVIKMTNAATTFRPDLL